tara:strand:+ start:1283 stop:1543 length:261 start_codon:yes stop_codon:yes gene_type:complete
MNTKGIDTQALDNIEVTGCTITDLDGNSSLVLKRVINYGSKPFPEADIIEITSPISEGPQAEGIVYFNTDSVHILATALNLMSAKD